MILLQASQLFTNYKLRLCDQNTQTKTGLITEGFPKTISSFSDEILLNRNCGGSQTEANGQVLVLFLFTKVVFSFQERRAKLGNWLRHWLIRFL